MGSFDVFSGGFGDSSRGLEAGGMVHGTGSWIGGGSACCLSAGVTWITACRLATGTESREMMWSSFFDIASCFSKTCTCLLAIAVSSSRSVDRGVDTSFQDGCSRSRRTDLIRLAVAVLLLVYEFRSCFMVVQM